MSQNVLSDNILDYGKEDVLKFIQTTIRQRNNVKDILDNINYVTGKVDEDEDEDEDEEGPILGTVNKKIKKKVIIEDRSSRGFYYERLWDLCIKFGVTDLTLPAIKGKLQTSHIIDGNSNSLDIKFKPNCWDGNELEDYLHKKVRSGASGGYSDITFLNKVIDDEGNEIGEELILISVKYFQNEKGIDKYDIEKLCALIKAHEKKKRTVKIYIFVKNKDNAIKKFKSQKTSSNILIKYINPGGNYENIYDINDLQDSFFKLKKLFALYNYLDGDDNINKFQKNYLNVLKGSFIPRFHQELFILKINKLIEEKEKNILVGAIPRSGKSYIMAGTILEYIKQHELSSKSGKKLKFLMMTPVPNETFVEYQSIFNNHIEFEGIEVITYKEGVTLKQICSNKDKHCVIIISKQKLGWKAGSKAEKILEKDDNEDDIVDDNEDDIVDDNEDDIVDDNVDNNEDVDKDIQKIKQNVKKLFGTKPDINVMFLDEAHFGMSTEKAKEIVDVLDSTIKDTIKIYVTATYTKPLESYGVKPNCKLTWDMDDIKIMQNLGKETIKDNSIQKRFGNNIYVKALEYFGDKTGDSLIDKLKKEYNVYPKPSLITSVWDKEFLNVEKLKIGNTDFGWDMNKLFATEGDSDNFANEEQIKEMMRYYFGYPDKKEDYTKQTFYRTRGILPRIRNICLNKCRTLQPQHKTTQLWFLPVGNGKIKNKMNALITLFTSNEFKDIKKTYQFFVAVDVEDKQKKGLTINGVTYMNNPRNIKNEIEAVEKKIKDSDSADNLIILAGQRLQMGISLRNVDIVTLWNSISSADAIFQMLFRSMTEVDVPRCDPNSYCDEKKFGFMVDMNPQRALTNVNLFSANISKTDTDNIQQYRQITDLINIDEDVLFDKYGDDEKSKNDFVKELFNKLYASWNVNVKDIKKMISKFNFDRTKLELLKKEFEQININNNKNKKDEVRGIEDDEMIDPGKKKEKTGEIKKTEKPKKKEKEIDVIDTATEVLSEFISLLNIFTLYADKGAQCMLTDSSKSNAQNTVIDDVDALKRAVYQNEETKNMFLKILNGRLTGDHENPYPEEVINSVLDSMNNLDDKLIVNKIIMSQKKEYYTINEPDKLLEFINGELKPKEKEKKENGEVFTPLSLVNEMLDNLDEAYINEHGKSIFTEVDFKWFDPAAGIGNFPIIVYQRLMKGLNITDEEEKRRHILENMIYAAELTTKNVFIYNKIFCSDKYKLNIYEGNTLAMIETKKKDDLVIWQEQPGWFKNKFNFKLSENFGGFDVVMGNPPYNADGTKHEGTKNIYVRFSELAFNSWLNPNGYFVFIHPPAYRLPNHKIKGSQTDLNAIYTEKKILYIRMYDQAATTKLMYVAMTVDVIIIQNTLNDSQYKSKIIDRQNYVYEWKIKPKDFIPHYGLHIMKKLINKSDHGNIVLKSDSQIHTQKNKIGSYKNIHGIIKDGIKICMSTIKHSFLDKPKFIINGLGSYNYVFYDEKGEYGMTEKPIGIFEPSKNTVQFIQSSLFHYIAGATQIFGVNFSKQASLFLPIIPPDIKIKNETDIYNYIGFTDDEIAQINKIPIPSYTKQLLSCSGKTQLDGKPIIKTKSNVIETETGNIEEYSPNTSLTNTEIPTPIAATQSAHKNTTLKKRPILTMDESPSATSTEQKPEKIYNPKTNRYVKNTQANRNKIHQLNLTPGGKSKKRTRKKYK